MIEKKQPVKVLVTIISLDRGHCLVTYKNSALSGGGVAIIAKTSYGKIKTIHDAVTYARLWLTGDLNALPETEEATEKDQPSMTDKGRQITIHTARNGYIVEVSDNDGEGRGWIQQFGDEVLFHGLAAALKFCGDYLEGKPGSNWYDWDGF